MPEPRAGRAQSQQPYLRHFVFSPGPSERNRPGYYALSFGVFVMLALALEAVVSGGLNALSLDNKGLSDALAALRARDLHLAWRWLFLFFAISYSVIALALAVAVKLILNRNALTLFTDRARLDGRYMLLGFLLYTAILTVPLAVYIAFGDGGLKLHIRPGQLLELAVLSCLLLIVQTATEEALFRGYITQFVASVTDSRAIIVLIPSLLFMFAHFDNPEVTQNPQVMLFYFGFGVFMSLIVLRERGLELAIAAHFSNNLVNSVLVRTEDGIFQTPAIFVLPSSAEGIPWAVAFAGSFAPAIYWLLTAIMLRRR